MALNMIFICCFGMFFHWKSVNGFSWGLDMTPSCVPTNLLCAYSEECCAGVCVHRVFFWIIKIKLCTLGNDLKGLPPESQLNYYETAEQTKNLTRLRERLQLIEEHNQMYPEDRERPPSLEFYDNLRPEIKEVIQKEKSTLDHGMKEDEPSFLNIYKPVSIPLFTTPKPKSYDQQEESQKNVSDLHPNRVSKDSKMYGGPLNSTGMFTMPSDKIHETLLKQSFQAESKLNQTQVKNVIE